MTSVRGMKGIELSCTCKIKQQKQKSSHHRTHAESSGGILHVAMQSGIAGVNIGQRQKVKDKHSRHGKERCFYECHL